MVTEDWWPRETLKPNLPTISSLFEDQHFSLDVIPATINWISGQDKPQKSKLFHLSCSPIFFIPMDLPFYFL